MKYRKRPVEIEAMRFTGENHREIAYWCGGRPSDAYRAIEIPTLEGVMRAGVGDWIIRGVTGEFYPCKADIFDATYEAVE